MKSIAPPPGIDRPALLLTVLHDDAAREYAYGPAAGLPDGRSAPSRPRYALLGAGWLVLKSEGELREWARRCIRWLAVSALAVLFLAFTVTFDYSALARGNLYARPWALVFPVIGAFALACAFVLALLLHRGLARNHGELRRRALERLPGLRATVQVSGHYFVDQRPRRVVRRDHPMQ